MSTKAIWKYIYIMAVTLIIIGIVAHIAFDQRMADENRKLTQQNAVLWAENKDLCHTVEKLQEQVSWDELYQDALWADLLNLISPDEPEQTKSNRGGERLAYPLTPTERDLIERVVMAEAGGETYEGQMLVAQCVLNACEIDGIHPAEVVEKYAYAKSRPEPSESVVKAVSAVFDQGKMAVDEPIIYFYAPARVKSAFHEAQRFVCEVGGHRFFAEAG